MELSDDIVTRLREAGLCGWKSQQEAANEIERLRAEVARLGSFLHPVGTVIDEQAVRGE